MSDGIGQQLSGSELAGVVVLMASVAHETNRAYCEALGEPMLGWESAPEWQKQSAIDGVGFVLENPECTPEDTHKNWMAQKTRDGWVYGKEKDAALKMHPSMVPYDQLPFEQRVKDYLFKSSVLTMAKVLGLE